MTAYLVNVSGPVSLLLDLQIKHGRFGNSSDPSLNEHLHYPNDLDGPLNEAPADKIRQYRTDYHNLPSNVISFIPVIASTSVPFSPCGVLLTVQVESGSHPCQGCRFTYQFKH